jgi:FkbM family methyltransferase
LLKKMVKAILPNAVWRRLRRARQMWELRQQEKLLENFARRVVRHSYSGIPLVIELADPVAVEWYDRDWPEMPELKLLGDRASPPARVFNLGAHQCVFAMMIARSFPEPTTVIAVEAMRENARVAQRNRELNVALGVQVLHAAIGDKTSTLTFNRSPNGRVKLDEEENLAQETVLSYSIDDLTRWYGPPSVVTLDLEGFEYRALTGARETLQMEVDWLVEVHLGCGLEQFGDRLESVLSVFDRDRYRLLMSGEEPRNFVPLDVTSPICQQRFHLIALANR